MNDSIQYEKRVALIDSYLKNGYQVILEGCDNTGKTYLANDLLNRYSNKSVTPLNKDHELFGKIAYYKPDGFKVSNYKTDNMNLWTEYKNKAIIDRCSVFSGLAYKHSRWESNLDIPDIKSFMKDWMKKYLNDKVVLILFLNVHEFVPKIEPNLEMISQDDLQLAYIDCSKVWSELLPVVTIYEKEIIVC